MVHVNRRAIGLKGKFDDIHGAHNSGAETARAYSQQNLSSVCLHHHPNEWFQKTLSYLTRVGWRTVVAKPRGSSGRHKVYNPLSLPKNIGEQTYHLRTCCSKSPAIRFVVNYRLRCLPYKKSGMF